jgi:hypothetical protein
MNSQLERPIYDSRFFHNILARPGLTRITGHYACATYWRGTTGWSLVHRLPTILPNMRNSLGRMVLLQDHPVPQSRVGHTTSNDRLRSFELKGVG